MVVVMASTVDVSITVDFIVVSEAAMVEEVAMDMDNGLEEAGYRIYDSQTTNAFQIFKLHLMNPKFKKMFLNKKMSSMGGMEVLNITIKSEMEIEFCKAIFFGVEGGKSFTVMLNEDHSKCVP